MFSQSLYDSSSVDLGELKAKPLLLISHDQPVLVSLRKLFQEAGFTQVHSTTGEEGAMTRLRQGVKKGRCDIELIILDAGLADDLASELCKNFHNIHGCVDIPIIALCHSEELKSVEIQNAFEAGYTDFLFKPIRYQQCLPRVFAALTLKKERDLRRKKERDLEAELTERRAMEARLQYLVSHDDLTGLHNRRHLERQIERALSQPRQEQLVTHSMLYIDLDQFKMVNDFEGHEEGDRLLISVANQLRQLVQLDDTLARISSDDFALLIRETNKQTVLERAESAKQLLKELTFDCGGRRYHLGASIGICMFNDKDEITTSEILARADQACYVAKSQGRNQAHIYSREDTETRHMHSFVQWVPRIRDALANDRFTLLFQPVSYIKDGSINRYEALIRMKDDDGSLIAPAEFIGVAERVGLIHEIDRWVVKRAIDTLKELPIEMNDIRINVNLSVHAFRDQKLLALIQEKLKQTRIQADRLTFEITESAAIANYSNTRTMINFLRGLGCHFALDDFGTGFNTFSYLKELPVDYLKIDGSFIADLIHDPVDQALVKSMVEVAHALGKDVVAEFVQDQPTYDLIKEYGVDYAQGYLIGKPAPLLETA